VLILGPNVGVQLKVVMIMDAHTLKRIWAIKELSPFVCHPFVRMLSILFLPLSNSYK